MRLIDLPIYVKVFRSHCITELVSLIFELIFLYSTSWSEQEAVVKVMELLLLSNYCWKTADCIITESVCITPRVYNY